jgi:hypothetical protein
LWIVITRLAPDDPEFASPLQAELERVRTQRIQAEQRRQAESVGNMDALLEAEEDQFALARELHETRLELAEAFALMEAIRRTKFHRVTTKLRSLYFRRSADKGGELLPGSS